MKYRVRIDAAFDAEADARAVFNAAKTLNTKVKSLNEGEQSFITLEACGHDESPPQPCTQLDKVSLTLKL